MLSFLNFHHYERLHWLLEVNRIAALRKTNTLTTVAVMLVEKHFGCSGSQVLLL